MILIGVSDRSFEEGQFLGKGNFTLGNSPELAPCPARLGSIWAALDGS